MRSHLVTWAHLAVLWSFAFAQPLFDILSDSPEFFVARENTGGDIVVLALGVTLVPPTLLLLVELLLVRWPRVREAVHLAFVGILVAAIALQALKDLIGGSAAVLIALSLALGGAGALAYARVRAAPAMLSVLSPAPLLFVVLFLFFSPVTDLVLPEDDDAAAAGTTTKARVPIVMVVFDEFSGASLMDARGRLDSTRYPNFARLARDATWYRNATTVADYTSDAVPAVLTGMRPEKDQLPIRADHPDSLFTTWETTTRSTWRSRSPRSARRPAAARGARPDRRAAARPRVGPEHRLAPPAPAGRPRRRPARRGPDVQRLRQRRRRHDRGRRRTSREDPRPFSAS